MIGYAGDRIPVEYGPALLVVGLALAVLVLLIIPAPAIASALELRLARRLRASGIKVMALALFGRGPRAIGSALASVLVATFALGPHVVGADVDGAVLLVAAIALFLAARVASVSGVKASARAALDVVLPGLVLTASVAGIVIHGGALHLAELVRSQGGSPWEWSALRQPVASALAFSYLGGLLVMLRTRDDARLLSDARMDEGENVRRPSAEKASPARAERNGQLLERLGLVVASGLGIAVFFGGWQLPGGVEARSTVLQVAAAVLFVVKTWGLVAVLLGAATLASPWTASEARRFMLRRLVPGLAVGAVLVAVSRKLGPSESLEAAVGAAVVTALVLVALRAALRSGTPCSARSPTPARSCDERSPIGCSLTDDVRDRGHPHNRRARLVARGPRSPAAPLGGGRDGRGPAEVGLALRRARRDRDVGRDVRTCGRACNPCRTAAAGRVAEQHVAQLARIGQLDVALDLIATRPRRPSPCSSRSWRSPPCSTPSGRCRRGSPRASPGRGSAQARRLLVVLADGLPTLAVGLQMATLAGWAMAGGGRARPLGLALAGDVAVVFVAWVLFWSLGGTFGASGYTPDPQPRFAGIVALPDAPRADAKATVSAPRRTRMRW